MKNKHAEFSDKIIKWYAVSGRKDLPWQSDDPYYVWISEIMLQQTQVVKVKDFFIRFIIAFPSLKDLAQSNVEQVLAMWSGLGYYNRARYIHKTAQICQKDYANQLPTSLKQLMELPGIGRSTAGAILSLAHKQSYSILDGNVKRVLSRYFELGQTNNAAYEKALWIKADKLLPQTNVREYNQAMMDIGSAICIRSNPKCTICPVAKHCHGRINNTVSLYPPKKLKTKQIKKTYHLLICMNDKKVLLQQRPADGIWPQLWFLPLFEEKTNMLAILHKVETSKKPILSIEHILSHRILDLNVYLTHEKVNISGEWVVISEVKNRAHPTALTKIFDIFEKQNAL